MEEIIYDESGFSSGIAVGEDNMASRHNIRKIEEVYKHGGEFYRKIIEERGGFDDNVKEAYEGFEHAPENLNVKRPNITRIWNLPLKNGGFVYGSSMGHIHDNYNFDVQEIYEFANYGGMVISDDRDIRFYVCRPKDKVIVPPNCMMTIFNLSYQVLETMDMANPLTNGSSKEILIEKKGPMIAFYHTGEGGSEYYSDSYLSRRFGNAVKFSKNGNAEIKLNKNYEQFGIGEDLAIDFRIDSSESSLVENILKNKDELRKYNIDVLEGKRIIDCIGRDGNKYIFDWPLGDLARSRDKVVHRALGMI